MKKLISHIALLLLIGGLATVSCKKEHVETGTLTVSTLELHTTAQAGASASLQITARYPWSATTEGNVTLSVSSGNAGTFTLTVTTPDASRSVHEQEAGQIHFNVNGKTLNGSVVVKRNPAVMLPTNSLVVGAMNGASVTSVVTAYTDFQLTPSNDRVTCTVTPKDVTHYTYNVTITALTDNLNMQSVALSHLTLSTAADSEADAVTVTQTAAIVIDRASVSLGGRSGATATLNVTSPFAWKAAATDTQHVGTATANSTVTVSALTANTASEVVTRGEIRFSLVANPDLYLSVPVYQQVETAPQAVFYYFLGTSLSPYYAANIESAMRAVDKQILGDSRVLVFQQQTANTATISEIRYDRVASKAVRETLASLTLPATYTAAMMSGVLNQMMDLCPAQRYGLVLASHGKGWIPKSGTSALSVKSAGLNSESQIWRRADLTTVVRHMGDAPASTQLDTQELATALAACTPHFDYLVFDACFMSNIETLYDLRSSITYFLGSPCEVMGSGFPYETVLPCLMQNGGTSYNLDAAAQAIITYYNTQSYKSACVAITDCRQLDAVAAAAKTALTGQGAVDLSKVQSYEGINATYNPTHVFYDVEDLVQQSCTSTTAVNAFKTVFAKCVTSRYHTTQFYSVYNGQMNDINYYSGVSTSDQVTAYATAWKTTAWYKATH